MTDDDPTGTGPGAPTGRPAPATAREALERDLVTLLQQLSVQSDRISHAFAGANGLHATDVQALLHVLNAESAGAPLTTGQLAEALGLSSGATTAVVDRLERDGHLRRDRDRADRRKIHLHYGDHGMAVAQKFFRPIGKLSSTVMDEYSDDQLRTVRNFLADMVGAMGEHRDSLGR